MIPGAAGAGDCDLMFVYGTLRRGFPLHPHLQRLGARFRAEATVAAALFDLGRYPGARPARGKGQWLHGELFQLRKPAHDLRVLDRVEDFIASRPERSEFIRAVAEVNLIDGTRERAWIYWLQSKTRAGRRRIPGGNYADWLARATRERI
jgi:gamma-glutamylcyclotransferase (GGCT)/AIG2-like uncharacterized protein YtfP